MASASTKASASPDSQACSRRSSSASSCRRSASVRGARRRARPRSTPARRAARRRAAGRRPAKRALHHAGQLAGRHHVGARALPDVQQTVVREGADRLADGVAGHAQLLDQLGLGGDAGAHRPGARGDLGAQPGDDLVGEGWRGGARGPRFIPSFYDGSMRRRRHSLHPCDPPHRPRAHPSAQAAPLHAPAVAAAPPLDAPRSSSPALVLAALNLRPAITSLGAAARRRSATASA